MSPTIRSFMQKSLRFPLFSVITLFCLLGHIDTASAQANLLQVSQIPPVFNSPVGGPVQTQVVNVTSSGAPLVYTIGVSSTLNWLSVNTNTGTTPGTFTLNISPGNLATGVYGGTVTLSATGANTVTITISLSVGGASTLVPSPPNLSFAAQVGSTATTPQTLTVTSASNNVQFSSNITYSPSNVGAWLTVAPVTTQTPAGLQVKADATGLAAGTYTATINLTSAQLVPAQVYVTFTVTPQPVLTVNQNSIQFFYQIGQAAPAQTTLNITSGTGNIPVNIATSTSTCGSNWLVVTPTGSSSTPANLAVGASVLGLTQNATCSGVITITGQGATNSPLMVPVTLTVSTNPLLIVTPSAPSPFVYQLGGAFPASQNLALSSSSTPLQFTASSNQPWLSVTPNGTTPTSMLTLSISPTALAVLNPGTYQAIATVTAPAASNSPINIPVTLTISSSTLFTVNPSFVNFNYQIGQQAPTPQGVTIGSTGAPIPFFISVPSTASTQFVTVNGATSASGTTGATVSVGVAPLPNVAGQYQNTLVITNPSGAGTAPQNVPVQLTVSNSALLNSSPQALTFTVPIGQSSLVPTQTVSFSSTDPTAPLTFTVTSPDPWLIPVFADGTQKGTTPVSLIVSIAPYIYASTSAVRTYTSSILITATGPTGQTQTLNIPVTLNVTSGLSLTASPTSLSFTQAATGAAPATQTVTIQVSGPNSGTLPYSAVAATQTGGPWLAVTPTTGATAPSVITVSITALAASLAPGTYSGTVVLTSVTSANPGGMLSIPVTLTVTSAPSLAANPIGVTLTANVGGANPTAPLAITAVNTVGPVQFTVTASSGTGTANWLSVTPASASTPASLTATANLAGLAAGTYNGTITITPAASAGSSPLNVPVTLTVGAQPTPVFAGIINAASGASGSIAPGEIVSLFGTGIGPATPAGLTLTAAGNVATTVGGVTVTFNGTPSPLTYVSATQINCVVPYEVIGSSSVLLQVSYNGVTSTATAVNVTPTLPGVFTQNGSGSGLGAIQQSDYSLVTVANAAVRGSTVIIYATGEGQTTPAGVTGSVAGTTLKNPNAPVSVLIGGQQATVAYAGSAPGLVSGVLQINVIVPTTIAAGNQTLVVTVGGASSQNSVSIPVQ
jgi:uncharacterized protein (TIGR03437 family)